MTILIEEMAIIRLMEEMETITSPQEVAIIILTEEMETIVSVQEMEMILSSVV